MYVCMCTGKSPLAFFPFCCAYFLGTVFGLTKPLAPVVFLFMEISFWQVAWLVEVHGVDSIEADATGTEFDGIEADV